MGFPGIQQRRPLANRRVAALFIDIQASKNRHGAGSDRAPELLSLGLLLLGYSLFLPFILLLISP